MQIWVHLNGIQQGPYSIEQLKLMDIESTTPVWYEGLPRWTPAAQAPATAAFFAENSIPTPPTFEQVQTPVYSEPVKERVPQPPTYFVWTILLTMMCCSPFALIGIITGAISSSRYSSGNIEGARRMSNVTELFLILAIVAIILFFPVSIILAFL